MLETARGGILLRGIGYAANDVAVVTNVSADHLGLQGIDTLDELAEVKAAIVRITRRGGWAVLNADDPRVWAMRRETRAGWYAFSLEPDSPRVREALARGGRAAVLREGVVTLLREGGRAQEDAPVAELPVTFGGLSTYNVANALAAAAACDALGFTANRIAAGLRSFTLDTGANPGRLNLYERRGTAGADRLRPQRGRPAGVAGRVTAAGRRARAVAAVAARCGWRWVLRATGPTRSCATWAAWPARAPTTSSSARSATTCAGRDLGGMNRILRAGVKEGGFAGKVEAHPSELAALQALEKRAKKGDVVAVMTHVERAEIADWLQSAGYAPVPLSRLRELLEAD